ncbi:MAG: YvcK family protein [Clostridiaceae bacterium]|nr:YvcK family protein [Clostridiaceae bacterium]
MQAMMEYYEALLRFARDPYSGPEIVVIGGGTGLATLLRGLKMFTYQLTAVVTVADDGGSSGLLRRDMGILPPGDIRNCLMALADTEPLMTELINYRFRNGQLSGHNFGNLFIAAMSEICGNFFDAVTNFSKVLRVRGRVLPVSLADITIRAELADGSVIEGEHAIGGRRATPETPICRIRMTPEQAPAFDKAIAAIDAADLIICGPGSLYTSIIPDLLFPEVVAAIRRSRAPRIFICNLMTQPSETMGYDCSDHIRAVLDNVELETAAGLFDYCVASDSSISPETLLRYAEQSAEPVVFDREAVEALGVRLVTVPLATVEEGKLRHDHVLLARTVLSLGLSHAAERDAAV